MPVFTYTPRTVNDKSSLTAGLHPAFLLAIRDEEVPDGWQMKEKSDRMWRWCFAVWETPAHITTTQPERQSATSSQTFSPGGKFQPSKAYLWTCKLLGRKVEAGESVDLDPLLPLPCLVQVTRTKADMTPIEYANIPSIEPWPDGVALLTPELRARLQQFLEAPPAEQSPAPTQPPSYAQPAQSQYAAAMRQAPSAPVAPAAQAPAPPPLRPAGGWPNDQPQPDLPRTGVRW